MQEGENIQVKIRLMGEKNKDPLGLAFFPEAARPVQHTEREPLAGWQVEVIRNPIEISAEAFKFEFTTLLRTPSGDIK